MTRTTMALLLAVSAASAALADDEAASGTEAAAPAEAKAEETKESNPGNFSTLPACRFAEGQAERTVWG